MLSISRPSAHYRAHADFMGIGVTADADIDIHDVQIYMDATATLTIDGLPEGGLQLKNFYVRENWGFLLILLLHSQINHLGSIDIDISGLGPLDWILELLVDFVDTFFRVSRGYHLGYVGLEITFCPGLDQGLGGGASEGPHPGSAERNPLPLCQLSYQQHLCMNDKKESYLSTITPSPLNLLA